MDRSSPLPPIFTIGHSTRSFEAFAGLLQAHEVACIVDVRKLPGSRRHPQFNADALADELAALGIDYVHIAALGGRRGRQLQTDAVSPNDYWTHAAFRRYADYAMTAAFADGLQQLLELAAHRRCALMCAEAVWWRCHRRIIADYLIAADRTVCHILGPGHIDPARATPSARRRGACLVYPAAPEEGDRNDTSLQSG